MWRGASVVGIVVLLSIGVAWAAKPGIDPGNYRFTMDAPDGQPIVLDIWQRDCGEIECFGYRLTHPPAWRTKLGRVVFRHGPEPQPGDYWCPVPPVQVLDADGFPVIDLRAGENTRDVDVQIKAQGRIRHLGMLPKSEWDPRTGVEMRLSPKKRWDAMCVEPYLSRPDS